MSKLFSAKRDWRYYLRLVAFALLVLFLVFYLGPPLYLGNLKMHPARFPTGSVSPADLGLDYTDVTLSTRDGLTLQGWYTPSTNKAAVILVHAYNGNRTGTLYHAALLASHGYGVLLYDTRAQGESEGDIYTWGWEDYLDVIAALDYLRQRPEIDPERIGVLGLSAGAGAALQAAAETDEIAAVVAEGARWPTFRDWVVTSEPSDYIWMPTMWLMYKFGEVALGIQDPMPLSEATSHIAPTPMLLIAAEGDIALNQACFDAADEPKTLWSRSEPGHRIDALFAHPEEYEERVIGFLDQALLQDE
jgi:pimeloyl-ACP methyl ester carboxylesterase